MNHLFNEDSSPGAPRAPLSDHAAREMLRKLSHAIDAWCGQACNSEHTPPDPHVRVQLMLRSLSAITGSEWKIRCFERWWVAQSPGGDAFSESEHTYLFLLPGGEWCNERGEVGWKASADHKQSIRAFEALASRNLNDHITRMGLDAWTWTFKKRIGWSRLALGPKRDRFKDSYVGREWDDLIAHMKREEEAYALKANWAEPVLDKPRARL